MALEPFDKFLSHVKNEEWKNMRSIVSNTFSSGKLKLVKLNIMNTVFIAFSINSTFY